MAPKSIIWIEIVLFVTLFSFRFGSCDVFVDEAGETEIIPIDDPVQEVKSEVRQRSCEDLKLSRAKREDLDSDDGDGEEEGSGETYDDDKEVRHFFG